MFIGLLRVAAPVLLLLLLRCAKPLLTSGGAGNLGMAVSARRPEAAPDPLGKRGGPQQAQRCGGEFSHSPPKPSAYYPHDDGQLTVSDAASKDGVYVNGKRVASAPWNRRIPSPSAALT